MEYLYLSVLGFLFLVYFKILPFFHRENPTFIFNPDNAIFSKFLSNSKQKINKNSGNLLEYKTFFGNPHFQTIGTKFARLRPKINYNRQKIYTQPDNGCFSLDWVLQDNEGSETLPIVMILAGLIGSSRSKYVRYLAKRCAERGYRPVVFNSRGCGDLDLESPKMVNAWDLTDLEIGILEIEKKFPKVPIFGAAYSLGSNSFINLISRNENIQKKIKAVVAISCPFDLGECIRYQQGISSLLYSKVLTNDLYVYLKKWENFLQEDFLKDQTLDEIYKNITYLSDFDQYITFKFNPGKWNSVEHYYEDLSCKKYLEKKENIKIPIFFINSKDDPLVSEKIIPKNFILKNENVSFCLTQRGGHNAFLTDKFFSYSWTDDLTCDFFDCVLEEQ